MKVASGNLIDDAGALATAWSWFATRPNYLRVNYEVCLEMVLGQPMSL